jgi:hypothetical protein
MTTKNTPKNVATRQRTSDASASPTLELVRALAPTAGSAEKIAAAFGLDPVDYDGIRETTKKNLIEAAETLHGTLSETAMIIHMQRVTGSFVGSAHRAATFYPERMSHARDLTSKLANDDRDEDREGVYGFESRAARFRQFAAEAGLTAYALMAAAEPAVEAHLHITGEHWKPYVRREDAAADSRLPAAAVELASPSEPAGRSPGGLRSHFP